MQSKLSEGRKDSRFLATTIPNCYCLREVGGNYLYQNNLVHCHYYSDHDSGSCYPDYNFNHDNDCDNGKCLLFSNSLKILGYRS